MKRYRAQEIAEFVIGNELAGLNEAEIVAALAEWVDHMEASGFPVGLADDAGAVEERDWLLRFAAQARGWDKDAVALAMRRDLNASSTTNRGQSAPSPRIQAPNTNEEIN